VAASSGRRIELTAVPSANEDYAGGFEAGAS
jgi:hypothetical protein